MANPNSSIFYLRSKGLTEQALAELGYKDTIVFRPVILSNTQRPDARFSESALLYARLFLFLRDLVNSSGDRAVTGVISRFTSRFNIDVGSIYRFSRTSLKFSPLSC
jgi:hypothetical protein